MSYPFLFVTIELCQMNLPLLNDLRGIAMDKKASVEFMDRIDARYLFDKAYLEEIIQKIRPHYQLIHFEGKRLFQYDTLYFDTPERLFYYQHLAGKLNRYKIRSCRQVETNEQYFELKSRNNKSFTRIQRIRLDDLSEDITGNGRQLLLQNIPIDMSSLEPAVWIYYHRIMLVNPETRERLTFDLNVWFRWRSKSVAYPNLVIADVQQEKGSVSPFKNLMKEKEIREGGVSKYCLGLASVEPTLKANAIKPILTRINRLNKC